MAHWVLLHNWPGNTPGKKQKPRKGSEFSSCCLNSATSGLLPKSGRVCCGYKGCNLRALSPDNSPLQNCFQMAEKHRIDAKPPVFLVILAPSNWCFNNFLNSRCRWVVFFRSSEEENKTKQNSSLAQSLHKNCRIFGSISGTVEPLHALPVFSLTLNAQNVIYAPCNCALRSFPNSSLRISYEPVKAVTLNMLRREGGVLACIYTIFPLLFL